MKTYQSPDWEPVPIVDQWLADLAETVAPTLPFVILAMVAAFFLFRGLRARSRGEACRSPAGPRE